MYVVVYPSRCKRINRTPASFTSTTFMERESKANLKFEMRRHKCPVILISASLHLTATLKLEILRFDVASEMTVG